MTTADPLDDGSCEAAELHVVDAVVTATENIRPVAAWIVFVLDEFNGDDI